MGMLELRFNLVRIQESLHLTFLHVYLYFRAHIGEFVRTVESRDGEDKIDGQGDIYQDDE
jgi:hypothetical protein